MALRFFKQVALTVIGFCTLISGEVLSDQGVRTNSTAAVFATNTALGRGVNLGNALEAPEEGAWGLTLEAGWFDIIADAGFDSVRVPIRWSAHANRSSPYRIDNSFFERVDWVLEQTRRTGLKAIINYHHDDELMADPQAHRQRFIAIWRQIASRYQNQPASVVFELLNEPHGAFDDQPQLWDRLFADTLRQVRRTNRTRAVLVGPVSYNSITRLDDLNLPDDRNLIVSVHYYDPFEFTHQGADWVSPVRPVGVKWYASLTDMGSGIQNWSWDTTTTPQRGNLQVRFNRRYAGFSVFSETPIDPTRLIMRVRGALDVSVACGTSDQQEFVNQASRNSQGWSWVRVDLSACPDATQRISLQNLRSGASSFELGNLRVCSAGGCEQLVLNARGSIRQRIHEARDWGLSNNRPMHLGEFGAYGEADDGSRIRWTRDVASIAKQSGLSSAYWEFAAGFGLYDPRRAAWRRPLLNAVMQ